MIYPQNFEQKIGFTQIREILAEACLSPLGRQFVARMQFLTRHDLIHKLLEQTHEFKSLLAAGAEFPTQYYFDVTEALNRAAIEGSFLDVSAFFQIKMSLRTVRQALGFFYESEEGLYPYLKSLGANIEIDKKLTISLDKVVDDNGTVKDSASPALSRLKGELIAQQGILRKQIQSILRHAKNEGWTPGDAEPTIRSGRIVIPVIAEYKRKVKGLIHDESTTGQTVYIEPDVVFGLNNDIKELENAYNRELIRILTELTTLLRSYIPDLRKAYQYLGLLDFIRAKAIFANRTESTLPGLHKQPRASFKEARHPLLFLSLSAQQRRVVPLTISLNPEQRILVISGPNAGGKSVALKTVGTLQYMVQCGLLIPVAEGSEAGIFENLFIDIGDEQSIENDLSTYSSHLQNMKQFVLFADKKSLVLIDEFGTGTEPQLGGAIAEAVLEKLNQNQAYGVITTHYTNLKNYAEHTAGIVNGAMRYDPKELQPLYQLDIGKPGSSFAIEIARKIGLPKEIVQKASKLVGKDKIRYDRLLEELEVEKNTFEKRNLEMETQERKLRAAAKEYTELKKLIEENKNDILREAKLKAKVLLKDTNKQIESTIKQIRDANADKEPTKQARQELEQFVEKELKLESRSLLRTAAGTKTLNPGDKVALVGQESEGEIVSVKGNTAEVMFGDLKTIVKVANLERVEGAVKKTKKEKEVAVPGFARGLDLTQRMSDFSTSLDVRGERAEDALTRVMSFVDDAVMLGIPEIRIIHGRGNGILKQIIRDYLRSQREVASISDEHIERGGDGVSLVVLK
ncbi:endonuclease MutS2 [Adhaeribacter pallidiroseus]|uniref:Endonuclease MutS2 n=1 Tax=Adhaeribacter pallidiroseus TaxID=2072847 RepID=A0A369QG43_9BACT|nr:Smr/MutS family protein [Adhaeribacter pallidiroseus]RDC63674.1 Endonuclease MutS2 [Adhaeribacter pallidiroseus]